MFSTSSFAITVTHKKSEKCNLSGGHLKIDLNTYVLVADMSPVATRVPEAFSLVLASKPPGGSGTMRWIS